MTKQEYADFEQAFAVFMASEGIDNLSTIADCEAYFSARPCDCCGTPLGGEREDASGYNPTTKQVCGPYAVCVDCVYYAEYGQLDDMTMLDMED